MFDYIKGIIERKDNGFVVVDVGGVGFKIATTTNSLQNCPAIGEVGVFYTYLHIREDILDLYGFSTAEERASFEMLISVSGVGPKAGLNILSAISPSDIALAIVTGDSKVITTAPGVGPKLAQRIILELKDKIKNEDLFKKKSSGSSGHIVTTESDAVAALMALGYSPSDSTKAVAAVEEGLSLEQTIKEALKNLMRI